MTVAEPRPGRASSTAKEQEPAAYPPNGAPTVVVMCVLALPPGGGKSTLFRALREGSQGATVSERLLPIYAFCSSFFFAF